MPPILIAQRALFCATFAKPLIGAINGLAYGGAALGVTAVLRQASANTAASASKTSTLLQEPASDIFAGL
jgi:hypothetical protein